MKMKAWLDQRFAAWRGADRTKTIQDFAEFLGVEYGALEHWMSGRRNPKRENVARLAEKLGLEAWDAAGFARPRQEGGAQVPGKFMDDWRDMTPEQRQELESFFATITAEELLDFLRAAIDVKRKWRGKRNGAGSGDSAPDELPGASQGGSILKKIGKRQGAGKT